MNTHNPAHAGQLIAEWLDGLKEGGQPVSITVESEPLEPRPCCWKLRHAANFLPERIHSKVLTLTRCIHKTCWLRRGGVRSACVQNTHAQRRPNACPDDQVDP